MSVILIQRAYKVELDLNNAQITACKKRAGATSLGEAEPNTVYPSGIDG
ncbi:MAG TPA: hypothetical protein VKQ36_03855 [Ktedonobacterales bacterium]|nr:hypothetical protein [Ktedonobacterales bacterium]